MSSAMISSMVVSMNTGKQFLGNWCSVKDRTVEINSRCNTSAWYNSSRRFSLLVKTKNGMKDVPLINDTAMKLGNENTEDFVTFLRGRFVEDRFVYMQNFFVRSYEIGPDKTISFETLTNFLQVSFFTTYTSFNTLTSANQQNLKKIYDQNNLQLFQYLFNFCLANLFIDSMAILGFNFKILYILF